MPVRVALAIAIFMTTGGLDSTKANGVGEQITHAV
jgi:hypothetical protein